MKVADLYLQLKERTEAVIMMEYDPGGYDDKVRVLTKNGRDYVLGVPQTILDRMNLSDEEIINFSVAWVNAFMCRSDELNALTHVTGRTVRKDGR